MSCMIPFWQPWVYCVGLADTVALRIIFELIKGEKAEYESAGPLFAYAVARRREIDTARIILSGKRNGLAEEKLRERLRETYV